MGEESACTNNYDQLSAATTVRSPQVHIEFLKSSLWRNFSYKLLCCYLYLPGAEIDGRPLVVEDSGAGGGGGGAPPQSRLGPPMRFKQIRRQFVCGSGGMSDVGRNQGWLSDDLYTVMLLLSSNEIEILAGWIYFTWTTTLDWLNDVPNFSDLGSNRFFLGIFPRRRLLNMNIRWSNDNVSIKSLHFFFLNAPYPIAMYLTRQYIQHYLWQILIARKAFSLSKKNKKIVNSWGFATYPTSSKLIAIHRFERRGFSPNLNLLATPEHDVIDF